MKTNSKAEKVVADTAPAKIDLALTERRKMVRNIPAPEAVESDRDTDWALFQALTSPDNTGPDPDKK